MFKKNYATLVRVGNFYAVLNFPFGFTVLLLACCRVLMGSEMETPQGRQAALLQPKK